jgi:hypothetical protein
MGFIVSSDHAAGDTYEDKKDAEDYNRSDIAGHVAS